MKKTIRLTECELHSMISEAVQKILKEYDDFDDFDDIPLSHKSYNLPSYGSKPVIDYTKEQRKKDNSPMGYFSLTFTNPITNHLTTVKSISYKKLQCLKNDLMKKYKTIGELTIIECEPFSDEERRINNRKIEQIYDKLR